MSGNDYFWKDNINNNEQETSWIFINPRDYNTDTYDGCRISFTSTMEFEAPQPKIKTCNKPLWKNKKIKFTPLGKPKIPKKNPQNAYKSD